MRRVLTPPFTPHKIAMKSTKAVISNSVKRLLEELDKCRMASNRIDLARYMKSVTLDIISRSAFSMDDTDVYEDNSYLRRITADIMEDTSNIVLTWATYLPFLKRFILLAYETVGKYTLRINQHLKMCIEKYYNKRAVEAGGKVGTKKEDLETKANILDFMLEQKEQGNLNENQVMGTWAVQAVTTHG